MTHTVWSKHELKGEQSMHKTLLYGSIYIMLLGIEKLSMRD